MVELLLEVVIWFAQRSTTLILVAIAAFFCPLFTLDLGTQVSGWALITDNGGGSGKWLASITLLVLIFAFIVSLVGSLARSQGNQADATDREILRVADIATIPLVAVAVGLFFMVKSQLANDQLAATTEWGFWVAAWSLVLAGSIALRATLRGRTIDATSLDKAAALRTKIAKARQNGDTEKAARAALDLGILLMKSKDFGGGREALEIAIGSVHPTVAAHALEQLGILLYREGDQKGASDAFLRAIAGGDKRRAMSATLNLARVLREMGDTEGARTAFEAAIASGDAVVVPECRFGLGGLLAHDHDYEGALRAYEAVWATQDSKWSARASFALGSLLIEELHDHVAGRDALQRAIDARHDEWSPRAALVLARDLRDRGDIGDARSHFESVAASGHRTWGPQAAKDLAAMTALQAAAQTGAS
jgi:tetratricopeptide (TPR) repeat protein